MECSDHAHARSGQGMLVAEIPMNPVIVLGEILVVSSPVMKRLGRIESVDEKEIRLPRGWNVRIILDG